MIYNRSTGTPPDTGSVDFFDGQTAGMSGDTGMRGQETHCRRAPWRLCHFSALGVENFIM